MIYKPENQVYRMDSSDLRCKLEQAYSEASRVYKEDFYLADCKSLKQWSDNPVNLLNQISKEVLIVLVEVNNLRDPSFIIEAREVWTKVEKMLTNKMKEFAPFLRVKLKQSLVDASKLFDEDYYYEENGDGRMKVWADHPVNLLHQLLQEVLIMKGIANQNNDLSLKQEAKEVADKVETLFNQKFDEQKFELEIMKKNNDWLEAKPMPRDPKS
jgi:hypothetical protein